MTQNRCEFTLIQILCLFCCCPYLQVSFYFQVLYILPRRVRISPFSNPYRTPSGGQLSQWPLWAMVIWGNLFPLFFSFYIFLFTNSNLSLYIDTFQVWCFFRARCILPKPAQKIPSSRVFQMLFGGL